jgi:hypothetical protein
MKLAGMKQTIKYALLLIDKIILAWQFASKE